MPINFNPLYVISPKMASHLLQIESAKEKVMHLPITPMILASLRETAKLYTTHYSTMIEGNRLEPTQIEQILKYDANYPGREREENEVKGYYIALQQIEQWAVKKTPITEELIQTLHALVMGAGRAKVKPNPYRDGQNAIRDSKTRTIVYMPPEAKDVQSLMQSMVQWTLENKDLPCPLLAGIIHYQFATIHPYYDGNGRVARLLTTLILHLGGYDLKGVYSLDEYYARDLGAYYDAISIGPSHNYYMGRVDADITKWLEYFIEGMSFSFESVLKRMSQASDNNEKDRAELVYKLDPKQRRILDLFCSYETITSRQVGEIFNFKPRTSAALCKSWVEQGFLDIADFSNKSRKYRLAKRYSVLLNR